MENGKWKNKSATLCSVADSWYLSDESDLSDELDMSEKSDGSK